MLFRKQPPAILSGRLQSLDDTEQATAYLGKRVYSTSGDYVGKVKDVLLKNQALAGLLVKGRRRLFLDKDYCVPGVIDSVILKVDPVTMLRRKLVFDSHGKRIGRVVSVERSSTKNACDAIIVKKHLFAKPRRVASSLIDVSKKSIILNKPLD
ncbi:PRC-barrel domain-containing protein [Candidatus Woesearchaeota archaeon]|nr:PRC-barrel domain-containing protein [Candidatus Woesearchaeota archaeon]